ncbi:hypothetical protein [Pelagicoccus mobilis]|uniref:Uncharacterized protein n=1 Tax=Pelagicoccus mobilis TaxID=415221 RepID=A0A934RS24_9BACT|nr:hypothetical protein [Pelagicoccus mobilis]MBK1876550.1 hypothetical protein [Pelagicoccus mobilis]
MPDSTPTEPDEEPKQDSVDLSDLKSFSFGTQWTAASKSSSDSGRSRQGKGGPRKDRRPGGGPPARKDRRPPRPPRRESAEGGEQQPRRDHGGRGHGDQQQGRRQFRRGGKHDSHRAPFQPYESQVFDVCFYPDDSCFSAIIKAMRANHLTYELFQVAKLFMEKPDRFIASVTRKAVDGQKPEKVFICAFDNMPFLTEEEVLSHAMANHASEFFTVEEVEVEAPSGNFAFVNRCPFTKELLGPPNYHKYETTLRNHHRTRLPNMSFEKLQSSIETVREEEAVAQWLESQKKATRYSAKEVTEGAEAQVFDSVEDAMGYLRTALKSKIVKQVNYARVSGTVLESFKDSEAFKAMDGERQRQQRFPLDTANAIRGRMRREKFSIYKKGAKGVTYVCSTKRNFRSPGQVMSPDLDRIIQFLEGNQSIKSKDMPSLYEAWLKEKGIEIDFDEKKVQRDLHWLIADGYISHFEDDSLFAQPVLDSGSKGEAKKAPAAPAPEAKAESAPAAKTKVEKAEETPAPEVKEEAPAAEAETPATEPTPEEAAPSEPEKPEAAVAVEEAPTAEEPAAEAKPEAEENESEAEKA